MALGYELSWSSLQPHVPGLLIALACCLVSTAVYRLHFSPLAKFPGPKLAGTYRTRERSTGCTVLTRRPLAALTTWYAGYHDLVRGGQYVFVVEEMHRKYGMSPSCPRIMGGEGGKAFLSHRLD